MNEDDLELLITLDDPEVGQDEDTFDHLQDENTIEHWLGQPLPERGRHDHRAEAIIDNEPTR